MSSKTELKLEWNTLETLKKGVFLYALRKHDSLKEILIDVEQWIVKHPRFKEFSELALSITVLWKATFLVYQGLKNPQSVLDLLSNVTQESMQKIREKEQQDRKSCDQNLDVNKLMLISDLTSESIDKTIEDLIPFIFCCELCFNHIQLPNNKSWLPFFATSGPIVTLKAFSETNPDDFIVQLFEKLQKFVDEHQQFFVFGEAFSGRATFLQSFRIDSKMSDSTLHKKTIQWYADTDHPNVSIVCFPGYNGFGHCKAIQMFYQTIATFGAIVTCAVTHNTSCNGSFIKWINPEKFIIVMNQADILLNMIESDSDKKVFEKIEAKFWKRIDVLKAEVGNKSESRTVVSCMNLLRLQSKMDIVSRFEYASTSFHTGDTSIRWDIFGHILGMRSIRKAMLYLFEFDETEIWSKFLYSPENFSFVRQ